MKERPVRGGCRWRKCVSVLMLVTVAAGCGGENPNSPDAKVDPDRPIATTAVVQPGFCGTDLVLSAEAADTGTPLGEQEILAGSFGSPVSKPDDYMTQTVIVDEGFGSFSLSAPRSFSPFWRAGTAPDLLLEQAEPLDEEWAGFWGDRMRRGDTASRAVMVDSARTNEVSAVHVTLTESYPQSGDELADRFAQDYTEGGGTIGERCGIRANGENGAFVEHTVPGDFLGGGVDRTQLQFLIPDAPNELLWGVTCDVPKSLAAEVKQTCRDIASTFRPLPAVRR